MRALNRMKVTMLTAACIALSSSAILLAADTPPSSDLPDLSSVRAKIKAKDFKAAVEELRALTETVEHADVYNLLAFSLRNLRDYDGAAEWYRKALHYDPDHKSALEYQGEMFVKLGQISRARGNVMRLETLCPDGCQELDDLKRSIATAGRSSIRLYR